MIDLIITYINFVVLTLRYLAKIITFRPPKEKIYREVSSNKNNQNNNEKEIEVLTKKDSKYIYQKVDLENVKFKYSKIIINKTITKNEFIPILFYEPENSTNNCIIYCQGNCCDIGSSVRECYYLALLTKCSVLTFEYPGYGLCYGSVDEQKTLFNVRKAYEYTRDVLNYSPDQIILYGFSLGTGVAFDIASDENYPIGGLILQSAFLSILRTQYNIKYTKYFDLFPNCEKAKNVKVKTFFIHGNRDKVVPYIHGRILSTLIPQEYFYKFYTVNLAGHNDIFEVDINIYEKMKKFIEKCNKSKGNKLSRNICIWKTIKSTNTKTDQDINNKMKDIENISEEKLNMNELVKLKEKNSINYKNKIEIYLSRKKEETSKNNFDKKENFEVKKERYENLNLSESKNSDEELKG